MVIVAASNILFLILAFIMWIPARNSILLSSLLAILIVLGFMSGVSGVAQDGVFCYSKFVANINKL
ncbi:hypothetical protein AB7O20_13235 [Lentilactobacillus buchneri]|uniref:hypothetical protein n=1 Tax=Lentilactobacillus buchneri TaxID=1581 RepID=UPI0034E56260